MAPPKGAPKKAGRKAGTPNKVTASVKAALIEAFDKLGGVPSLVAWGQQNPDDFYKLWAKLLPTEVHATGDVGVTVQIVRFSPEVAE